MRTPMFFVLLAALLAASATPVRAGFVLGLASNYGILVEPGAHNVQSSNGIVTGNIGIGSGLTGQFQNTSGQIVGNVDFAGAANIQNGNSPAVTGAVHSNVAAVTSALNTVNALATTLGAEPGTSVSINVGNNGNQIISAGTGTLDSSGNRVFTVSNALNLNSNSNTAGLTINGTATDYVVINFSRLQNLNGAIILTGGLTSDHVLFNYINTNGTPVGGNFNASSNHHTLAGTFLVDGATVTWNAVTLNGRLFGGASSHDFQINSGFNLNQPVVPSVPEPFSLGLIGLGAVGLSAVARLRRRSA